MTTPDRAGAVNLYEVLGVAPDADAHQLDQAFRVLARRHHPDTRTQQDAADQPWLDSQRFQEILAAYAVLRDPVARAAYDLRTTPAGNRSPHPAVHHVAGPRPPVTPLPGAEPPLRAGPVRWHPTSRQTVPPVTDRPSRPTAERTTPQTRSASSAAQVSPVPMAHTGS